VVIIAKSLLAVWMTVANDVWAFLVVIKEFNGWIFQGGARLLAAHYQ
jgi:hypothetical protein